MKPFLKIVDTQQNTAFQIMNVCEPYFFPSWHFHPEFEIMLVREGSGIRFVGDSIERFQPGDLVLYGSNIAHLYRSDEEFYSQESKLLSKATVVYFRENFPGENFWKLPEMGPIKKLLQVASQGIKFIGDTRTLLEKHIGQLAGRREGMDRIIDLLTILRIMATSKEFTLLSGHAFMGNIQVHDCERINAVYQYILDNYTSDPTLEDVAKIACMSTTAFCRYFKTHTNKTYVQFLNEVKIGNATKMLIDNKLSISQICFETGFNNFNHFNNLFKRITGFTPGQYQQQFIESPMTKAI
jgi:AraC-like DNA-binding protein/quercetin dioxygenase-like cupin family protein